MGRRGQELASLLLEPEPASHLKAESGGLVHLVPAKFDIPLLAFCRADLAGHGVRVLTYLCRSAEMHAEDFGIP